MNNWGNYMGMGQQPQMQQHGVKPLLPPQFMLPDLSMNIKNINSAPPVDPPQSLIGPVLPDNMTQEDMAVSDDEKGTDAKKDNTEDKNKDSGNNPSNKDSRERDNRDNRERADRSRHDRRSRDRDRDRGGNSSSRHDRNDRVSDRNRDRYNRNDRKDRSRDRDRRERRSKWDDNDKNLMPTLPNDGSGVMMPGMPGVQGMPGMGQMGQGMMPGQQGIGMGLGAPNMPGMSSGGSNMPGMGTGGPNMSGMGPGGPNMPGMGSGGPNMPGMGPGGPNMPGMGSGGPNMPGMGPGGPNMPGMGSSVPNMPGMSPSVPNMPGIGLQGGVGGQGMMPYGMQNMPNAGNMQNMGMMPGMNNMMMGNMMDPNMMMMNRPMMMPNQPIYVNDAMLLPPIAGNPTPKRRDKPPGCRTIFVGGLPKGVSEETISQMFESFGVISDIKVHRQGVCHVRFASHDSVEASFAISGYRYKTHDQTNNEATTLFVDYALNREDQNEFERSQRQRQKTPPRIEPYNPNTLNTVGEKIKNDEEFHEAAPTLIAWLEHGECNKRNANAFYSLIQASNNQVRRLFNEKMTLDEEFHNMKSSLKEKFAKVVDQFEQVAKILAVAKHQRVSDHFTKQQRRNIEMWLKMTEELENIKEEFNALFDDEETDRPGRNVVPAEKYEQLRVEHENLMYELEGYRNEAHLAKDEAERKFEKFKAHYIAQQALQGKGQGQQVYPPLPPPPTPNMAAVPPMPPAPAKPQPPPPTPDDNNVQVSSLAPPSEGKLISILTAFLMSHPLGASLDYMVSYVRSMVPNVTQATVHHILHKYSDVFGRKTSGIGANIEHRWGFVTFDIIKTEAS